MVRFKSTRESPPKITIKFIKKCCLEATIEGKTECDDQTISKCIRNDYLVTISFNDLIKLTGLNNIQSISRGGDSDVGDILMLATL